ncbi:MAG: OmpA family protein, partial [Granulosicoccaceae bacterium]
MNGLTFKRALACSIFVSLAFPAAHAANSPDDRPFKKRLYLGASVGVSELEPESTDESLTITDDQSTSGSLTVGYDISPRFSVDAYAGTLGEAEVSFLGTPVDDVDYTVYGVSLISYLFNAGSPYSDSYDDDGLYQREGLSTYLRVGVGGMTNDTKEVEYDRDYTLHLATGLGLEYGWSNGVAVRAEVSAYDTDARQLSVSALKRIGDASYAGVTTAAAVLPSVAVKQAAEPALEPIPIEQAPVLGRPLVLFAFDQIEVKADYYSQLNLLAEALITYPDIDVQIDGHTDWVGSGAYNMDLSERRAESVAEFLIDRGVKPERLHATGYGEHLP